MVRLRKTFSRITQGIREGKGEVLVPILTKNTKFALIVV